MINKIQPIAGDASFRTFYRLFFKKNTKILVYAKKNKYENLVVYDAINRLLRKNKILTPRLFKKDYKNKKIVIEDFGNITFKDVLLKKKNKFIIYKKIIDLLIKIQKIKIKKKLKTFLGNTYIVDRYDMRKLNKESDLFFDWYLPLFLNLKQIRILKPKAKKILNQTYRQLYFKNNCFVHRDYHVSNLMKFQNKIAVIDTQDALMGNPAYDLVSLIDDVRIKTSSKLKKKIFEYYLIKKKIKLQDVKYFINDFNILSVQRSLKIIGIFSRLYKRDKKKKYLKFIPYTWQLLEMRLKGKNFKSLKLILNKAVNLKLRRKVDY